MKAGPVNGWPGRDQRVEQQPIRVLIVNDSPAELELLRQIIQADPQMEVMAVARDGTEALKKACVERPDVIAMDVYMPNLDGLAATRQIMANCPAPIVIVTASASYLREGAKSFRALEMGALALVATPPGFGHPQHAAAVADLLETLKAMSEVKVVHRWILPPNVKPPAPPPTVTLARPRTPVYVVAIGASAGGPLAIKYLLAALPKDLPVPILIVQHMAAGFIEGFAAWLRQVTGFAVSVATHRERPRPGHAYLAPSGCHMGIAHDGCIVLSDAPPEDGLRPAVSYLFRSVDAVYGRHAIGILLSGMGADGVTELGLMRQHGAVTIAQHADSAIVYGMPGEAVRMGTVTHELPIEQIPAALVEFTQPGKQTE
jgi:two-component system chemotaxis response regulator CheB